MIDVPAGDSVSISTDSKFNSSKKQSSLFLKNSNKILPPRRDQLPVTNAEIDMGDNESEAQVSPENQYQMAMNEALKRHEQSLHKVKELRKAQEDDFRHQINMESDIIKLETEQANYKKTKLNEDL